jgi:hypothetical protein
VTVILCRFSHYFSTGIIMRKMLAQIALEGQHQENEHFLNALSNRSQHQVALEGILSSLREAFARPAKGGKLGRDDLVKAQYRKDSQFEQLLSKTLFNEDWVRHYYDAKEIHLGSRDYAELMKHGKLESPVSILSQREKDFEHALKANHGQVEKYIQDLHAGTETIEKFYQSHSNDVKAVEQFAQTVIEKIKLPSLPKYTRADRAPDVKTAKTLSEKPLPRLSLEEALKLSQALKQAASLVDKNKNAPWRMGIGGDFEESFWDDKPGYKGEILRTGPVGRFFYHQGTPEEVTRGLNWPFDDLRNAVVASAVWLSMLCGGEKSLSE